MYMCSELMNIYFDWKYILMQSYDDDKHTFGRLDAIVLIRSEC